jgi:hypothetical protein
VTEPSNLVTIILVDGVIHAFGEIRLAAHHVSLQPPRCAGEAAREVTVVMSIRPSVDNGFAVGRQSIVEPLP